MPLCTSTCSGYIPPALYIMVLPAMGIISEIVAVFIALTYADTLFC